jgi:hypothetical protein
MGPLDHAREPGQQDRHEEPVARGAGQRGTVQAGSGRRSPKARRAALADLLRLRPEAPLELPDEALELSRPLVQGGGLGAEPATSAAVSRARVCRQRAMRDWGADALRLAARAGGRERGDVRHGHHGDGRGIGRA